MTRILFGFVSDLLYSLARWAEEGGDLFRRCPYCGEYPISGKPCK